MDPEIIIRKGPNTVTHNIMQFNPDVDGRLISEALAESLFQKWGNAGILE